MRIIDSLDEMTKTARGWLTGGKVGFVTITSSLHEGHKVLVQTARVTCEILVVCLLEKTALFGLNAVPARQPYDLMDDIHLLSGNNIDVIFIPRTHDLYPPGFATYVTPDGPLIEHLLPFIPAFSLRTFATTITKLLQLIRPDITFFGQKNAQQVALIRQIVRDLNIDMKVSVLPTVREHDGLAFSNRNRSLTPAERQVAPIIHRALFKAKTAIDNGERQASAIERLLTERIAADPLARLEYISVCHAETFAAIPLISPGTLITLRAQIGEVHLVDNILWLRDGQWRI